MAEANAKGFTVDWSAETLEQADEYADLHDGPVVCVLPAPHRAHTCGAAGDRLPCRHGDTDCLNCGICQQRDRQAIVGFTAHGSGAKRVQKVLFVKTMSETMTT